MDLEISEGSSSRSTILRYCSSQPVVSNLLESLNKVVRSVVSRVAEVIEAELHLTWFLLDVAQGGIDSRNST